MARLSDTSDQILFHQVMGFIAITFAVFIESAMGHIAALFGATPKLVICLLFIMVIKFHHTMTIFTVFTAGLIFDLTQGSPLGFTSSIYLIVFMVAEWRQLVLIDADAGAIWSEFVLLIAGVMVYSLMVFGLYEGRLPPFAEIMFQIGLTVLIFPVLNWAVDLYRNIGLYFGGVSQGGRR